MKFRPITIDIRHNMIGSSLVEVLVTVLIISIGLLGVAALNLASLRNSFDADSRTMATALANDITDKMRANANIANGTTAYEIALGSPATGNTTIAEKDILAWKALLGSTLVDGDGSIARTLVGSRQLFTITIQWTERDGGTRQFITQTGI